VATASMLNKVLKETRKSVSNANANPAIFFIAK